MLYIVGMGLWDEKDITVRGLEAIKASEKVYLETYTTLLGGLNIERLEKEIGKPVIPLSREDVEVKAEFIKEAKQSKIAILVGGDPLVATTHHDLAIRAKEQGVSFEIIHNASIVSAISETGLQSYKFGRTVTVPFPRENFRPRSFYDHIIENLDMGLHTLVLLDIDAENNKFMTVNEGLKLIKELDKPNRISNVIGIARLGSKDKKIVYGPWNAVINEDFGNPPHCIVVPGKLHDVENRYISLFWGKL